MLSLQQAGNNDLARWDSLIHNSINGTLFHLRRFLSYHGEKFEGSEYFLLIKNGDEPFVQISLTLKEENGKLIAKSPYGASYGGFVFQKYPTYEQGKEIVRLFLNFCLQQKVREIVLTHPIACCSQYSLDTFYFCLLEAGFKSYNRDISNIVFFDKQLIKNCVSAKVRNQAKKAIQNGVYIKHNEEMDIFWIVLEKTFAKHGKKSTHTLEELKLLKSLFPDQIYADIAYKDKMPIAGVGYFIINSRVNSSFYLCQDPYYQNIQGLTLLTLFGLEHSQQAGFQYFDFGTSSVNMKARSNIFNFKEQYTKIGTFRETFIWTF